MRGPTPRRGPHAPHATGGSSQEGRLDVDQREEHAELLDLQQLEASGRSSSCNLRSWSARAACRPQRALAGGMCGKLGKGPDDFVFSFYSSCAAELTNHIPKWSRRRLQLEQTLSAESFALLKKAVASCDSPIMDYIAVKAGGIDFARRTLGIS